MKKFGPKIFISYSVAVLAGIILSTTTIFSLSVGSNTTGSRQPLITFPAGATDNTMLGFAVFEAGFTLASNTTTCTYDDFFPVSGPVTLNGGTLFLKQDLLFGESLNIVNSGGFTGANHSIEFGSFIPDLTLSTSLLFDTTTIVLNTDTTINGRLQFRNACKILGRGKALQFQGNGRIVVRPGATLTLQDVDLQGVKNNNVRCFTDRGAIILQNVSIGLANDYTFSQGSILFSDDVVITGTTKFIYTSGLTSTIDSQSLLFLDQGVTFSYAPRLANKNLIFMTDASSQLYLNGCTLHSTRTGLQLSAGTLIVDNKVTMSSEARFDAEALNLKSNLNIILNSGGELDVFGRVKYG